MKGVIRRYERSNQKVWKEQSEGMNFHTFWLLLSYLLITPFIPSDYPFHTFWLLLSYLLITPFIPSDYPFHTFWLLLSYLLITPFIPSDYSIHTFWLPLSYLLITPFIPSYLSSLPIGFVKCLCFTCSQRRLIRLVFQYFDLVPDKGYSRKASYGIRSLRFFLVSMSDILIN
jgi:hypothetical protein